MQELVLRSGRPAMTASRSSLAGQRLPAAAALRPASARRSSLRCNAVAEVAADVERRGEVHGAGSCRRRQERRHGRRRRWQSTSLAPAAGAAAASPQTHEM